MLFHNREEAAKLLADKLTDYKDTDAVVLAVPRGAVPMGKIIADRINGELDVLLVQKISAPDRADLAIGSVDERGDIYVNEVALDYGYTKDTVRREGKVELENLRQRRKLYSQARPQADVEGRPVIIVDDGIVTGSTMLASIRSLRALDPESIVVAMGVAPPATAERLQRECDELVVLYTPAALFAVGHYFQNFGQVTDEEVMEILKQNYSRTGGTRIPYGGLEIPENRPSL